MPRSLFEDDFEGEALEEFRRLADDDRVVLEEMPLPDGNESHDFAHGAARDALYGRLMDYLVRRSNVLIALWDGEVTGLTGGSSDVVLGYLAGTELRPYGNRSLETINDADLAEDRSDLVVWIKTPRQSSTVKAAEVETSYLVRAGSAGLLCRLSKIPKLAQDS